MAQVSGLPGLNVTVGRRGNGVGEGEGEGRVWWHSTGLCVRCRGLRAERPVTLRACASRWCPPLPPRAQVARMAPTDEMQLGGKESDLLVWATVSTPPGPVLCVCFACV